MIAYLFPLLSTLIPIMTRVDNIVLPYSDLMMGFIPPQARDTETTQTSLLSLSGISLAALLGVSVINTSNPVLLQPSLTCLLTSFFAYFFAHQLEGYKWQWWQDQASDALHDIGSLSMISAIYLVVDVIATNSSAIFIPVYLAFILWVFDHYKRVRITRNIFRDRRDKEISQRKEAKDKKIAGQRDAAARRHRLITARRAPTATNKMRIRRRRAWTRTIT